MAETDWSEEAVGRHVQVDLLHVQVELRHI